MSKFDSNMEKLLCKCAFFFFFISSQVETGECILVMVMTNRRLYVRFPHCCVIENSDSVRSDHYRCMYLLVMSL